MSKLLKKDTLTDGVISNLLEESFNGRQHLRIKELQEIHEVLLKLGFFREEAERVYFSDEIIKNQRLKENNTELYNSMREERKNNYVTLFPEKAFILNDGIHAAGGAFNYIYRAKGQRIFWNDKGLIYYRAIYCTIDENGMEYSTIDMGDELDIFSEEVDEELVYTSALEEGIGSIENLILNLTTIKQDFLRDYPIEYLLFPKDVEGLSDFSLELKEQIWVVVIELVKDLLINPAEEKNSCLYFLVSFLEKLNIQPKALHIMKLLEFYKDNNQRVELGIFHEILEILGTSIKRTSYLENNKEILKLSEELKIIQVGSDMANTYHDLIFRVLNQVFDCQLMRGSKEVGIDKGKKRIDIVYDNVGEKGFFSYIKETYRVYCPKIIIECKNYSSDPKNPEIDQLIGRLGKHTGELGILICRTIKDKQSLLERCQAALNKDQGYIIFLTDDDIHQLINLKADSEDDKIFDLLMLKWDSLVLNKKL